MQLSCVLLYTILDKTQVETKHSISYFSLWPSVVQYLIFFLKALLEESPRWPARNATHSVAGGWNRYYSRYMFFFTYVLQSSKDNKLYIGWTTNLKNRVEKHNNGKVFATRERAPLKLIYYEACLSKSKAIEREK